MAARTSGFLGTVRRLAALSAGSAMLLTLAGLPAPGTASADAGNPILGTIHGSLQPNADGTVTVFVRGEWHWLPPNSDCTFDRSATGLPWRGGCGRERLTSTTSNSDPFGEATATTCANGTTTCSGHPWGSWGYEKLTGGVRGYAHTYARRRDISQVCVNFYDVHGGGKRSS